MLPSTFMGERLKINGSFEMKYADAREAWQKSLAIYRTWQQSGLSKSVAHERHERRTAVVAAAWDTLQYSEAEWHLDEVMHRLADLADLLQGQLGTPHVRARLSDLLSTLEEARKALIVSVEALDAKCQEITNAYFGPGPEPFEERLKRPLVGKLLEETQAVFREFSETNASKEEAHACTIARYSAAEIAYTAAEDSRQAASLQIVKNQLCDMADLLLAQHASPGIRERLSKLIPDLETACADLSSHVRTLQAACKLMMECV
ncbi:hypothetical protein AURDEDRAFT_166721 [Auricularia subglabra TFB-10046 SS5]|nr:hypothetical protein AURDEDRAFT_166721 [Auricularia subglabra TFB-10046 SS5]